MTQDRTYFRMLSDTALADAARYCDNDLALVLGERLRDLLDVDDELEAARGTIKELQADIADLHAQLDAMEAGADHDTHTN
jgi:hypothetical protein